MNNSRFVYVTYIRTRPEKLWQALIDPEFTRRFWNETRQDCEWKPGATWRAGAAPLQPARHRGRFARKRVRDHVSGPSGGRAGQSS